MISRTWKYGTRHRGRLLGTERTPAGTPVQMVQDLDATRGRAMREGHVIVGKVACDETAEIGD